MSDKKTLLEEGTVRRFMKLANMEAIGSGFVNEMYTSPMADDEDLEEGRKKKKGLREDETLEETTEEINEEETDLEERASAPMADDDMPEEMEVADLEIEDEEDEPQIKIGIPFKVGDRVRVKEGNFENQEGDVDAVDEANGRVTVIINIFGRSVPMELDHWQVEPL